MDRHRDVFLLRRLVSAGEEQQKACSSLRVVDAVSWAEVDLQLRHAISKVSVVAWVTVDQAINTNQDPCSSCSILQGVEPLSIDIGLFDAHVASVAPGLRCVNGAAQWLRGEGVRAERRSVAALALVILREPRRPKALGDERVSARVLSSPGWLPAAPRSFLPEPPRLSTRPADHPTGQAHPARVTSVGRARTIGCLTATLSSVRAAPVGSRRPCSQSYSVRGETPSNRCHPNLLATGTRGMESAGLALRMAARRLLLLAPDQLIDGQAYVRRDLAQESR